MALRINSEAPNFTADTTQGKINFHEWISNGWAILFSHPKDFTPVCTTELGYMAGLKPEFDKRNCKIIGLSVDPVDDHKRWSKDIEETQGHAVTYPMIGDPELLGKRKLYSPARLPYKRAESPVLVAPDRLVAQLFRGSWPDRVPEAPRLRGAPQSTRHRRFSAMRGSPT